MTLKTDGTKIVISNASGTEKFNSNNKLMYRKFSQTGSASLAAGLPSDLTVGLVGTFNPNNDLAMVSVNISSAGGNIASQISGSWVQLNFPLLTHFAHSTTDVSVTAWDMLSIGVLGDSSSAALKIDYVGFTGGILSNPVTAVSLDWKLVVLSYR